MPTDIEWTRGDDGSPGETWNPLVGCSRVSPGCDHCYAIGVAHRGMSPQHRGLTIKRPGERTDWTGEVREVPHLLEKPFTWRRPRRVFVNSLSDLFHPDVTLDFILSVFTTMGNTPRHTYQVLTKRPQRMAKIVDAICWDVEPDGTMAAYAWPGRQSAVDHETGGEPTEADLDGGGEEHLPNVWLGTSIENDRYTFRADHLRATPAAVRFLSLEPLLGPLPSLDLTGIDWVIVGGESGPGARPMDPEWVLDIRDRCRYGSHLDLCPECNGDKSIEVEPGGYAACGSCYDDEAGESTGRRRIPFFFKHWGEHDEKGARVGKHRAGRRLDRRIYDEFPTPVEAR